MTIRSLNLIPTPPWPPRSGGDLRAWNLLRQLSSCLEQTVLCRSIHPLQPDQASAFADLNIRLINEHIPRPSLLTRWFKGFCFLPGRYPVHAAGWYFSQMRRTLQELLRRESFDVILIETSWLGVYWPILQSSRACKVLDLYDLMGERLERQAALLAPGLSRFLLRRDARKMTRLEHGLVTQADLTLVTSRREREILVQKAPGARIRVAPNGVDTDLLRPLPPSNRREILFVGALDYQPNVDAVLYFVREIFPLLRHSFSDLVFTVVGRSPPPEIKQLQNTPGIQIAGEVDSVEPYYRNCSLCVVPLRAGGGTRLKIPEALAYGRPVVSTPQGCEGIEADPGQHLLLAGNAQEFIDRISELLLHPERAAKLAANGRALVEAKYSWKTIAEGIHHELIPVLTVRKAR